MPLILLIYPFLEIYSIVVFSESFSFWDFFLFSVTTGMVGIFIIGFIGKALLMEAQRSFSEGRVPDSRVLHRVLILLGGILILIPGVISDALGLVFVLPGVRHLIVLLARFYLSKMAVAGSLKVFKMGNSSFGFSTGFDRPETRDARVIDVEAIESSNKKSED